MVSSRARSLDVSSVELASGYAKASGGLRLHLCEAALHEQLRSRDETRRPSRSPRAYRACRAAQCWKAPSWSPLVVVALSICRAPSASWDIGQRHEDSKPTAP